MADINLPNPLDFVTKGEELIGKVIDRLFPDQQQNAEAKLKYAQMLQNGELDEFKAEIDDRKSARSREVEIDKTGKKDYITPALSILVTFGFFSLLGLMCFYPIPQSMQPVTQILIGTLAASFTAIIQYYFGSSSGSKQKDYIIATHAQTDAIKAKKG